MGDDKNGARVMMFIKTGKRGNGAWDDPGAGDEIGVDADDDGGDEGDDADDDNCVPSIPSLGRKEPRIRVSRHLITLYE